MVPQYEFTKTIRFTLNGENTTFLLDKDINWQKTLNFNDFQISFNDLLNQFKKTVFYINNNGKLVVKNSLEIKKSWLRQYARDEFYKFNENQRKYNKFPAKLFQPIFNDWFKRNKSLLRQFEKINQMPQESQIKRSEILTLLQEIKIADNFLFIKNFVQPGIVNDKKSDYNLEDLKEKVNRFEELLNKAIFAMAPDLSQGAEVCRASLSYYTVNKISKRDFDKELEYKKQELKKPYNKELNQRLLKMVGFLDYLKSEYQSDIQNISIQNLYEALKQFKSQRKSEFMQAVQQGKQVKELIKDFPLFNAQKDSMQKFIYASKDKRGIYFQNQWGFPNYVNFCNNVFKPVAIKIGNLKAQIRAIEQEKIEARLLQYWAHILKKDNKYYLLLIPKEKMQEVKKFLNSLNFKKEREYTLYSFNSLTLRALKKLIRKNLGKEQIRLQNDNTAIALYKEVFQDKHPKLQNLDFSGFEKDIKKIIQENYNSEEDFLLELERVAYCCFEKNMNQKDIDLMRNKFSALLLEISAYDFERNIMGEMKEHSKIWQKFWTVENKNKNFPVRLNPEIRIFYRPQRQQGDPKKQKNRFAKDHFGVAFTITQNAAQKKLDLAFTKEKEISEAVKKFNKEVIGEFIKERDDNLYYYGIDRGQQELATLCVMRFSKEQGEIKLANGEVKKFDIPIPTPIKLYRIKENHLNGTKEIITDQNGKKKIVRILENPSYFIDEEEKLKKSNLLVLI